MVGHPAPVAYVVRCDAASSQLPLIPESNTQQSSPRNDSNMTQKPPRTIRRRGRACVVLPRLRGGAGVPHVTPLVCLKRRAFVIDSLWALEYLSADASPGSPPALLGGMRNPYTIPISRDTSGRSDERRYPARGCGNTHRAWSSKRWARVETVKDTESERRTWAWATERRRS